MRRPLRMLAKAFSPQKPPATKAFRTPQKGVHGGGNKIGFDLIEAIEILPERSIGVMGGRSG